MKYYTAVGSRKTPAEFVPAMANLSRRLRELGWIFRSGKADGADAIFQTGVQTVMMADTEGIFGEVYKPWNKFNTGPNAMQPYVTESGYKLWGWWDIVISDKSIIAEAQDRVSALHPAWDKLSAGAKALHTRNVFQVLGKDLCTPSEFLVCYAPVDKYGIPKGGTRTSFILAKENGIPCFNFATENKEDIYQNIKEIIGG